LEKLISDWIKDNCLFSNKRFSFKKISSKDFQSIFKSAAYEDEWSHKIEKMNQQNPKPFSAWFANKGRAYIPFKEEQEEFVEKEVDQNVANALRDAGYQITDYRKGLCSKDITVYPNGRNQAGTGHRQNQCNLALEKY